LHGDLHHGNVLLNAEGQGVVIDPQGVLGPLAYDCGPFLRNWAVPGEWGALPRPLLRQRVAILAETLELEESEVARWGAAHAVLSACWSVQMREDGWEYTLETARRLAEMAG
ncbi:MAG TPA: aminoglycoside phosphotransferase family protein, partial [Deinococcales bacterium]|nr:aminoglycoside phosphotransferase family protein [Deinococcales bacterium]